MVVFSELYYPKGWKSYINGKQTPHFRVNYALRGMLVPAGDNQIEFRFEPEVVETGSQIALAGSLLFVLIAVAGLLFTRRRRRENKSAG
ncbi:MAG: LPXTG cell wall anchor domain-containing protein [Gammaproteobacteria bacterium]|nr:LPXTG cell wall anchor domain-containing protein [Gammaproteobacteria bacterium]